MARLDRATEAEIAAPLSSIVLLASCPASPPGWGCEGKAFPPSQPVIKRRRVLSPLFSSAQPVPRRWDRGSVGRAWGWGEPGASDTLTPTLSRREREGSGSGVLLGLLGGRERRDGLLQALQQLRGLARLERSLAEARLQVAPRER